MDFNQLLEGLHGWPAALVLTALILGTAWVVVAIIKNVWND